MGQVPWGWLRHPARGILHGGGALVALPATLLLARRCADDPPRMISMLIFGASLVGLLSVSATYHCGPWPRRIKKRLQRLDHAMIFILVAGAYTPIAYNVLSSPTRWILLTLIWSIALVGSVTRLVAKRVRPSFTVILSTAMGWLAVAMLPQLLNRLGWSALPLLATSAIAYTVGAAVFAKERPRLIPAYFGYHEFFHLLVDVGAATHFAFVWIFVVPYVR